MRSPRFHQVAAPSFKLGLALLIALTLSGCEMIPAIVLQYGIFAH